MFDTTALFSKDNRIENIEILIHYIFKGFQTKSLYCFKSPDLRNRNNASIDEKMQFN